MCVHNILQTVLLFNLSSLIILLIFSLLYNLKHNFKSMNLCFYERQVRDSSPCTLARSRFRDGRRTTWLTWHFFLKFSP